MKNVIMRKILNRRINGKLYTAVDNVQDRKKELNKLLRMSTEN